jgi:hypothetical protein
MDAHHSPELLVLTLSSISELVRDAMRPVVFDGTRIRSGSYQEVAHLEYRANFSSISLNTNALNFRSGADFTFS